MFGGSLKKFYIKLKLVDINLVLVGIPKTINSNIYMYFASLFNRQIYFSSNEVTLAQHVRAISSNSKTLPHY